MQKRLFVAVSLSDDVKKRLFRFIQKEYKGLPISWVRAENYHITLNFLGYSQEESIPDICRKIQDAVQEIGIFSLEFSKAEAGPDEKNPKKLIWAKGEKSENLGKLKNSLDRCLGSFFRDRKDFTPHITLGRIKRRAWQKMEREPLTEKELIFSVPVESVELFESKFEKGKRVYYVLESFELKKFANYERVKEG